MKWFGTLLILVSIALFALLRIKDTHPLLGTTLITITALIPISMGLWWFYEKIIVRFLFSGLNMVGILSDDKYKKLLPTPKSHTLIFLALVLFTIALSWIIIRLV